MPFDFMLPSLATVWLPGIICLLSFAFAHPHVFDFLLLPLASCFAISLPNRLLTYRPIYILGRSPPRALTYLLARSLTRPRTSLPRCLLIYSLAPYFHFRHNTFCVYEHVYDIFINAFMCSFVCVCACAFVYVVIFMCV